MNFAQMTVTGNVGSDPEIKDVNGTKVANFSIAVNENYTTKGGDKVEKTHWYRVEAWDGSNGKGLVSNVITPYLKSGTTVFCQGQPIVETYEQDGVKKTSFKLKLAGPGSTFRLGGSKGGASDTGGKKASAPSSVPATDVAADDIPF